MKRSLGDRLVAEYASRLDSALILAISSEYHDDSQDDETAARATLNALADAATSGQQPTIPASFQNNEIEGAPSSVGTTTTDEEEVERAFRDWSLQERDTKSTSSNEEEDSKDVFSSTINATDPISFLKSLFPRRDRVELDLAFQDSSESIEVSYSWQLV